MNTHTHTQIYIYIYIYMCVCVCVCVCVCDGNISYQTPKMDSSNLNIFSELAKKLLVSYETVDRETASRERLVLLLYDFFFLLIQLLYTYTSSASQRHNNKNKRMKENAGRLLYNYIYLSLYL